MKQRLVDFELVTFGGLQFCAKTAFIDEFSRQKFYKGCKVELNKKKT